MERDRTLRLAILSPGDREKRTNATAENSRFADLFAAFAAKGIRVEPAMYHDDFSDEVRQQLMRVDGVLVWANPIIEDGRDRAVLDSMLRDIAGAGIFVSAHPDVILKLGTKEVLFRTRDLGWGCDTHLYGTMDQMIRELPLRLAAGKARVLKQYRGNGGDGVWKIQLPLDRSTNNDGRSGAAPPRRETIVTVRHAKRGCGEERIALGEFYRRCEPYFSGSGRMIDQEYQERLPDGTIRCYLVHDKVVGFGHQAINALFPAPPGAAATPEPGRRLYHPPSLPQFQALKGKLEHEWIPDTQRLLDIERESLPILWDCDFLFGPKGDDGEDTYVLCEINVSSVAPYPESAVPYVVEASIARAQAAWQKRFSDRRETV